MFSEIFYFIRPPNLVTKFVRAPVAAKSSSDRTSVTRMM